MLLGLRGYFSITSPSQTSLICMGGTLYALPGIRQPGVETASYSSIKAATSMLETSKPPRPGLLCSCFTMHATLHPLPPGYSKSFKSTVIIESLSRSESACAWAVWLRFGADPACSEHSVIDRLSTSINVGRGQLGISPATLWLLLMAGGPVR